MAPVKCLCLLGALCLGSNRKLGLKSTVSYVLRGKTLPVVSACACTKAHLIWDLLKSQNLVQEKSIGVFEPSL